MRTAEFGTEGEVGGRLWVGSGGGGKVVGGGRFQVGGSALYAW